MAHREWTKRLKELSDKIDIDALAKLFDLAPWDELEEYNVEYFAEAYAEGKKQGGEAMGEKYERETQDEIYHKWYSAVERATGMLFQVHGLDLIETKRWSGQFKIIPRTTWEAAAREIMKTINGVGMFEFSSVKEFIDSGPYTARQAVLTHLHHMRSYPEVYGHHSVRELFDRAFGD